jgi:hypothetical protein
MTLLPDEQAADRIRHERQRQGLCDPPCRADKQRHASFEMDPVLVAVERAVEKNRLARPTGVDAAGGYQCSTVRGFRGCASGVGCHFGC